MHENDREREQIPVNPPQNENFATPAAESQTPSRPQQSQQQTRQKQEERGRERHNRYRRQRPQGTDTERQQDTARELSILIPLFNEEQSLRELYDKIRNALNRNQRFEIIFVDDGSTDNSMRILHDLRHRDRRIKIIRFRRNYGKSAALSVGFNHAKGDIIITMDADLQDDPNEIPNLVNEIKKGFDLVSGWKKKRRDPITKTIPSKFFNFVVSKMTGIKLHDFNCGLKAYRKEVVKEIEIYGELHRYIPVLAHWRGFKIGEIVVQHYARKFGKTKYGLGRFWKGFLDLVTTLFTTRYLQRPLHFFGLWGLVFFLIGIGIDAYLVALKFVEGIALSNRPLFLGGILLTIVGVQIISIGLLGEMIAKTRPVNEKEYSIKEFWK
ncbi:MAG: glycosyltransferase family 2 protein [Ignavibacteriales bacterium]|nr:glycosyltransferase family 2 protein [Ignavibacteriales bacterium]